MAPIGHYEILEKLGEGGMGVVWKARDTRLERIVAIKLLPAAKTADPGRRQRFVQEARAASALNHPNIVTIYDIDRADGADFIAMEYVPGKTLDQLIPKKGLRVAESLKYAIQIAGALAAAHAAGIVHRDLKPGNVVVSDKGAVKVLDFGLAKLIEEGPIGNSDHTRTIAFDAPRTEEGTILGTAAYMSPEQAEGKKVDARSDIFSFGALLYEMLTGRRAFEGGSNMSTLAAVIRSEPEPLDAGTDDIPRELVRIVQRCLRKDPGRRAHSMQDLKLALEELKEDSDSGAAAAPAAFQAPRSRLPVIAAAVGLALAAGGAYRFWPANAKPEGPLSAVPLTTFPGYEQSPSFSPDGNQVAFSWNGEGGDNYDIYVKLIGSGRPLRLTTDPGSDRFPVFSPDGRSIAFVRLDASGNYSLLTIPTLGGSEREVAQLGKNVVSGTGGWTPDGRWLLISMKESNQPSYGLFLVSLESGETRRLTTGTEGTDNPGAGDMRSSISPDGRSIAFERRAATGTTNLGELYLLPLKPDLTAREGPKRLTADQSFISGIAWSGHGDEIVFSSARAGAAALWRMSASRPEKPRRVAVGENPGTLAISLRTNRLVYEQLIPADSNIWRVELANPGAPATMLINSTRMDVSPQYSPDSRKVTFLSSRSGTEEIWVCDADGSNATQLTTRGNSGSPHWSADGRQIVFDSVVDGRWQIFVIGANGGQARQFTRQGVNTRPSWSRDGKWIYFASNRTGRTEVWKQPSSEGNAVQISKNGGNNPVESVDGTALYYNSGQWMVKSALDGGGETRIIDGVSDSPGNLAPSSDGVYYLSVQSAREIHFVSYSGGPPRVVVKDRRLTNGQTVSPDGKWLLYTEVDGQPGSDLMLAENFH